MTAVSDVGRGLIEAVADASPDGLLVIGADGAVLYANQRLSDIWGIDDFLVAGRHVDDVLAELAAKTTDPEAFLDRLDATVEISLPNGDILDRIRAPLRGDDGTHLGWAWYFRDVTAHRRVETNLRDLVRSLQSSLIPPRPPEIPGMEVATRFRPVAVDVSVGGDFYDVFRLGVNDWGLAIGDVCGSGARAAALSTLTRYTLRAAAVHSELPSDVLQEVNRVIATEPEADDRFCSVAFARVQLDTCGAWVTLATAGHPRPIVVRSAGWIDHRGQPGTVLGMFDETDVSDDRVGLGPGDAIVFCTDGITEARSPSGEMFGDEAMADVLLRCTGGDADTIARDLTEAALDFANGHSNDDVAVLVVKVPDDAAAEPGLRVAAATGVEGDSLPLPPHRVGDEYAGLRNERPAPPREARIRLPAAPTSARRARQFVAGVLHSWRMSEMTGGDAELLVSELVSNVYRHAGGEFGVNVRYDGDVVRLEVDDTSAAPAVVLDAGFDATGGRGLYLVQQIAGRWGSVPTPNGKRVWAEISSA